MTSTPPLLLHIGYHKTATTWMQKHLFMPQHGYRQVLDHQQVFDLIVKPHGLRFSPAPAIEAIAKGMEALQPGEQPVISSEVLSGHPFQGGHESDVYAERLAQIAPDAKILISIRDQMRIIPSVYMQYLQRGGTLPYRVFFAGITRPGYFGFTDEHFEYDVLAAHYQSLFGDDAVYVLTQESLQKDMDAASAALAGFVGARGFTGLAVSAKRVHAAGYPENAAFALRRVNHIQKSTLNPNPIVSLGETPAGLFRIVGGAARRPPFKQLLSGRKPVSDYVARHFSGRYTKHNERLQSLVRHPIDLSGYC